MVSNTLVDLQGITKRFGGVVALSGVDLQINSGEVLALLGENGAGKSTLLSILSGQLAAGSGTYFLDGRREEFKSAREAKLAGIHVVRQEPTLFPELTVAENLLAGDLPRRFGRFVSGSDIQAEANQRLNASGFADMIHLSARVRDLSPGERQLVEIAKALAHSSTLRLVAFDEPTSSLAVDAVDRLFEVIERLRVRGIAVVYVSHRMDEIFRLADRITVLRDGASVGTVDAAGSDEQSLVKLMVGRDVLPNLRSGRPLASESTNPALEVRALSTIGLSPIDLRIYPGEVLGVAGLVKSGRSRLARSLFGLQPISSGDVFVHGQKTSASSPSQALRAGIVLVPEDRHAQGLAMQRSVKENITMGRLSSLRRGRLVRGPGERKVVTDLMGQLRIKAPSMDVDVSTLSGGNQQKTVLARAVSRNPIVLILDEPTRGVDVGAKAEIYELIRQLADAGTAILLISSELPELLNLSDRIIVMREGALSGEIRGRDASEESILRLAMPEATTPGETN